MCDLVTPDFTNPCQGGRYEVKSVCLDEETDAAYQDVCAMLSSAGEWAPSGVLGSPCRRVLGNHTVASGCLSQNATRGRAASCSRVAYTGDPVQCCLNNYSNSAAPSACYSDAAAQNTCDPQYTNINGSACESTLFDLCTGAGLAPNDDSWLVNWSGNFICPSAINLAVFGQNSIPSTPAETTPLNSAGYFWARSVFTAAAQRYWQNGFSLIALPGEPGYNDFSQVIYPYFQYSPGLGQDVLSIQCSSVTLSQLTTSVGYAPWCGCYMAPGQYSQWVDQFRVPLECSPPCNNQTSIQLASFNSAGSQPCTASACILDNVTLSLSSTNVNGDVTFSQVCGSCGGGNTQCVCSISDVNLATMNSDLGDINLTQNCGQTNCFRRNASNQLVSVSCAAPNNLDPNDLNPTVATVGKDNLVEYLIVFIVLIVLLLLIYFLTK